VFRFAGDRRDQHTADVTNQIEPASGGAADETGGECPARQVAREVQLLREQLLEPPKHDRHGAVVAAVLVVAIALAAAGFVMFTALA